LICPDFCLFFARRFVFATASYDAIIDLSKKAKQKPKISAMRFAKVL